MNGDNPIFEKYRKKETVMAQQNVQLLKKRTEGKRNSEKGYVLSAKRKPP